eukprot:XP_022262430.1 cadherin-related family member 4 isoform X5 [Canis lupus familiaris]
MMALLRPPVLLLALVASEVHCLPWFINVSESQGPGTILKSFPFNCTLHMPILELIHVKPPTTFFNPPSLTRWHGIYMGMVTLSSSARLDALAVNHYELQLRFTCGNYVMEGLLFVDVQRDPGYSSCAGRFASPGEARGSRQGVGRHGLNRASLTFPLASWGNHSGSGNSHTRDPAVHSAAPRRGTSACPDKHHQCPGPSILPWTFLYQWARLAAGAIPGPQRPGSKGLPASDFGDLWTKSKLPWDAEGESFACSLQSDLLPQAPNITIREDLAPGSEVVQVRARGFDVRYEILSPVPCPLFSIGRADGLVRTAAPLESALARGAGVAVTRLRVKAYERLRPRASVELDLTVNVRSVNRWPPRCLPAMLVTEIRETTLVGTVLNTFTCTDPDSSGSTLDYELRFYSPPGLASLCLRDRALEVNATLDCDAPGACFQHAASILVLNGDQPLTEVPVLVMVTPVNEFSPACVPHTFRIREDAGPYTLLGSVVGMDKDYPHNSIEYFISGGPSTFSVDRLSGEIHLLGSLDYELQKSYRLTVLVTDHSQDQDPTQRRSGSCTITIEVEVPSMMTPLLVTDTEVFWQPEPWFVVVLTVTSALFLLALGWLFSRLFQGLAQMLQTPNKPAHELLLNSIQGTEESIEGFIEAPRMEMPQAPSSVMSLEHFDGRAQDPREPPSSQTTLHLGPLSLLSPSQYFLLHQAFTIYFFPEWGLFSPPFTFQLMFLKHL